MCRGAAQGARFVAAGGELAHVTAAVHEVDGAVIMRGDRLRVLRSPAFQQTGDDSADILEEAGSAAALVGADEVEGVGAVRSSRVA